MNEQQLLGQLKKAIASTTTERDAIEFLRKWQGDYYFLKNPEQPSRYFTTSNTFAKDVKAAREIVLARIAEMRGIELTKEHSRSLSKELSKKCPSFWNRASLKDEKNWKEGDDFLTAIKAEIKNHQPELYKIYYPEETKKSPHGEELKSVNNPQDTLDNFFNTETIKLALEQSGLSKEEFVQTAISFYVNRPKSIEKSIYEMSIEELKANKKKSGVGTLLIEKAVDKIIEYNGQCKDRDKRYQIGINMLKDLTGCNTATIQSVVGKYNTPGTKTEDIEKHHEMMGIPPHNPAFNRGKPSIKNFIDF